MLAVSSLRTPFVSNLVDTSASLAFAHFGGSGVALVTGVLQFHKGIRVNYPRTHRWLGRLNLLGVVFGGISGGRMALDASGGAIAQYGFVMLTFFWLAFTAAGYLSIRRNDVSAHRRWMTRSFALTFGAVTLRLYLPASLLGGSEQPNHQLKPFGHLK